MGGKKLGYLAENLDSMRVPITSNQREKGNIPYYGASGIIDYVKDYIYDESLLCISEDGANLIDRNYPIAFNISGKTWVNNHAHVLRFENSNTQILVEKYINSLSIEDFLTGMAQPKLNRGKLDIIPIPIPKNPQEQQKIASCLSSLDEVIAAYSQKLELLKDHKKGLMQNLFPQEGEKVPKYRFKEFEKDGAWVNITIDKIAKVSAGGTPESTNPEYWNGNIPWMNSGELNNKRIYSVSNYITSKGLKESSTKLIPPKCVLIGLAGQGKTRGTAAINYIELCTNQSIGSIHPNESVFDSEFLYHKIDSMYEKLRYLSAGDGGRGGLNLQIIKEIDLLLPDIKEQQKIASCLSSLDALITAQEEKIEQLKLHKKGLMQGLFPKINE
ncbi:MAG: restriction endonuclease subunit S [Bacteroidetes bacterium]|nr:restriction endonuclease subunit S [Bacteroidota bacterium]